ncbi:MAG: hypothetical protein CRU72_13910 [Candidatus Accumulibacter phosphatis]|nr:hypothetical protein [Candidatus Accumulibacter phosphatis]
MDQKDESSRFVLVKAGTYKTLADFLPVFTKLRRFQHQSVECSAAFLMRLLATAESKAKTL